jgi:hypothetical protein
MRVPVIRLTFLELIPKFLRNTEVGETGNADGRFSKTFAVTVKGMI